jgi:hypothetical protein
MKVGSMYRPEPNGRRVGTLAVTAGIIALLASALIAPSLASAALSVKPLVITGKASPDAPLVGLLVMREVAALDVVLVPGVLVEEGGVPPIPADAVAIDPATFKLTPGIPTVVRISVTAPNAGTFRGQIQATVRPTQAAAPSGSAAASPSQIAPPSSPPDEPIEIEVTATNATAPALVGEDKMTTRRLDDGPPLIHPFLAWLFVDPVEREATIDVPLTNPSTADINVTRGAAAMTDISGGSGHSGVAKTIPIGSPLAIHPGAIASVGVPYDPAAADPGQYVGVVNLTVDETTASTPLPLDLTVRQGPTAPFLIMLAGLLLGALFKWSSTRGDAIAKAAARRAQVEQAMNDSPAWPEFVNYMRVQSATVADYLVAQPELALAELSNIANRIDLLNQVFSWKQDHQDVNVMPVIELLRLKRTEDAQKIFKELQDAVIKAGAEVIVPEPDAGFRDQVDRAGTPRARALARLRLVPLLLMVVVVVLIAALVLGTQLEGFRPGPGGVDLASIVNLWPIILAVLLLGLFLFSDRITAVLEHNLNTALSARSVLRVVLSLGLVLVGMRVLYTEDVATTLGGQFNPIFQYLLWGLGADVSAQALSKAKG